MDDAGHEDAFAPDAIAEPASNQHQRAKHQRVGVHHPLHVWKACPELPLDDGQSDHHDGAVDEGHRRGEHRRRENKPPLCFRHGKRKGDRRTAVVPKILSNSASKRRVDLRHRDRNAEVVRGW